MIKKISVFFRVNKYTFLLLSLLFFVIVPAIFPHGNLRSIVYLVSFTIILVSSIQAIKDRKSILRAGIAVIVIGIIANWVSFYTPSNDLTTIIADALITIFFVLLLIFLLYEIFNHKKVDIDVILGSIAGYLILGIIGAVIFNSIEIIHPDSFAGDQTLARLSYYSFVTLTTLGYGDIAPLTDLAEVASSLLAIAGQLYLTIIIALLVGKYFSTTRN